MKREDFYKYKKREWDVHVYESCTTTFDIARQKIEAGAQHGDIIISDMQTGGKGRQARKWHSPSGGLWMGVILKPEIELAKLSSITLLCAAAVCKAMEQMYYPEINPKIKWPNDVYINDMKVCGILTETIVENNAPTYVIVGIGINANNDIEAFEDEVNNKVTSFKKQGIQVNRGEMASYINENLLDLIDQFKDKGDLSFITPYYFSHMQWVGEQGIMVNSVTGDIEKRGTIKGIDADGRLLLESDGIVEKIVTGELSLRRE